MNDYYVYLHKRKDTGEVFYVGHGRKDRHTSIASRSKLWKLKVEEAGGFDSEIVTSLLTKYDATKLETSLISKFFNSIVNSVRTSEVVEIDHRTMNEVFYYDETSKTGLRYKKDIYKNKGAISKFKDQVAGNPKVTPKGKPICYKLKITINDKKLDLMVHRIVWVLNGNTLDPNLVIDHKDGNPFNNRIENLQQISQRENTLNRPSKNPIMSGVYLIKRKLKQYWKADWTDINGIRREKLFSCDIHGYDEALKLAKDEKIAQSNILKLSGITVSDRHLGLL